MGVKGIDVSTFQGVLDWNKIKAAGIQFAILRGGYGRYEVDETFAANAKGATAAGIPIGVYWFSYALNASAAREEAQKCLQTIKGYNITLPVFFDFEGDTVDYARRQGVTLGREAFNAHTVAFCDTIEAAGYRAGTYYNLSYLNSWVDKSRIGKYVQWFAQYNDTAQASGWDIWQYTSSGYIAGCSGRFDMNIMSDEYAKKFFSGNAAATKVYEEGWKSNSKGYWWQNKDGSWPANAWKQFDGAWYWLDSTGYVAHDKWVNYNGKYYYVGKDGRMVTNHILIIGDDGTIKPGAAYYYKLGEVPEFYREHLDALIEKGYLKGKGGSGDDLILDMGEDTVRQMVVWHRSMEG